MIGRSILTAAVFLFLGAVIVEAATPRPKPSCRSLLETDFISTGRALVAKAQGELTPISRVLLPDLLDALGAPISADAAYIFISKVPIYPPTFKRPKPPTIAAVSIFEKGCLKWRKAMRSDVAQALRRWLNGF